MGHLTLGGFDATSPVGAFPPNGFGLFAMAGNVWETDDLYAAPRRGSCGVRDDRKHRSAAMDDARGEAAEAAIPVKVVREP